MKFKLALMTILGAAMLSLAACEQPLSNTTKGAAVGGVLGAGSGALIGNAVGSPGTGALIGGGLGALGGGVIGHGMDSNQAQQDQQQQQLQGQQQQMEQQRREIERLRQQQQTE
jgi:uncharacterized protein YcfJ